MSFVISQFQPTEEKLKHITADAAILLANNSNIWISLVGGLGSSQTEVTSRYEERVSEIGTKTDVIVYVEVRLGQKPVPIGIIDLKGWHLAYLCTYATPDEHKHVALAGPPFHFTFGRLHPRKGPDFKSLFVYENLCSGWKESPDFKVRLNDPTEWEKFYSAISLFVLYGLFIHFPEFREALRGLFSRQGQEALWGALEHAITQHFSDEDEDISLAA
ncbi:hypothetical protein MD484_g7545, partial [Candolleomyces efflorescens]